MSNPFRHHRRASFRSSVLLAVGWGICSACYGQSPTLNSVATADATADATHHEIYRSIAGDLEIQSSAALSEDSMAALQISRTPVMTWTGLGGWSGDVFVWSGDGRIQLIGCVGSQQTGATRNYFQEFVSLATTPIDDVNLDQSVKWRVPMAADPPHAIAGVPPPSASARRRLSQLRDIAKQFNVGMQVSDENRESSLRLLPQPLAREVGGSGEVVDSALFAVVSSSGTDPEAFLLIEARRVKEELIWTYQPARFTTREVWMFRDGEEIWHAPAIDEYPNGSILKVPYFFRYISPPNN